MVYLHLDAEHLPLALEWLYQVVFCPTLAPDKLEKERKVVINEKGGEFGRLHSLYEWVETRQLGWDVSRAVQRRLFPESSLLLPVIGTDASLKAIDRTALLNHYRQHYVPNNMTLIAVGEFAPETLREQVEAILGIVPRGEPPPPPPPARFDRTPFTLRLRGPAPNEQGQFLLGAPLGPDNHPDRWAWWVLAELLERAYTQEIRHRHGLTYDVNVYTSLYPEGGYFAIYTQTEVANFPMVREVVERGLARMLAGDCGEEELEDAKTIMRGRTLLSLQSNLDLVWWYSVDTLIVNDEEPVPDYFAAIRAVNADTLQRVAQTYLRPEQRFSVVHNPLVTPRRARPWAAAGVAALSTALLAWRRRSKRRLG